MNQVVRSLDKDHKAPIAAPEDHERGVPRRSPILTARRRAFVLGVPIALLILAMSASPAAAASGATITVNSLADTSGSAACTLRDAISSANSDTATGGCVAGLSSGPDSIVFSGSGTIALGSQLPHRDR